MSDTDLEVPLPPASDEAVAAVTGADESRRRVTGSNESSEKIGCNGHQRTGHADTAHRAGTCLASLCASVANAPLKVLTLNTYFAAKSFNIALRHGGPLVGEVDPPYPTRVRTLCTTISRHATEQNTFGQHAL